MELGDGEMSKWLQMRTMHACVSMIDQAKSSMREMRPTDCSKIARAMGKLDLQDEDLCVTLVDALKVFLPNSPPIAVAGILAGLGQVSYRYVTSQVHAQCLMGAGIYPSPLMNPSPLMRRAAREAWLRNIRCVCRPAASVLHSVERYVVENSHRLTPKDVKDFLVAFTAMEAPPDAAMVNASILQLPKNFQDTLPKDLATLIAVRSHPHSKLALFAAAINHGATIRQLFLLRAAATGGCLPSARVRTLLLGVTRKSSSSTCRHFENWTSGHHSRLSWPAPTSP